MVASDSWLVASDSWLVVRTSHQPPATSHQPPLQPLATSHHSRGAYSLLEVILALAILTGAVAVLGEAARNTVRNVTVARLLSHAELLCESKLAEIVAGLTPPNPDQGAVVEEDADPGEPGWQYTVEVTSVDSQGLIAAKVTVRQDLPAESHPIEFSLVRWMTSPDSLASLSTSGANSTSQTPASSSSSGAGGSP